ncbi:MAG: hypothetical protein AAGA09_02150 [Pseudomonadota bacterium]
MFASWQEWIAWAGLVLPLATLAWAALFFVITWRGELRHKRYEKFFALMDRVGDSNSSILGKMAAVYEMREYDEYKEVIVRLCQNVEIKGDAKHLLDRELDLTAQHFGASRSSKK